MEFITPVHLEDLELDKPGRLSVTDVLDAAAVGNTDGMLPLLEGAEFAQLPVFAQLRTPSALPFPLIDARLEVQSDCMVISEERVFDAVYGVLRCVSCTIAAAACNAMKRHQPCCCTGTGKAPTPPCTMQLAVSCQRR